MFIDPAILNTLRHICYFTQEVVDLKIVNVNLPVTSYEDLVALIVNAITPKTRLAVFDHITSATGFVLPIAELIAACHARDVPVLVDGAHGPGQLPLNLNTLQADFYVANCYKWLFSAKSVAFLHVNKSFQATTRPVVTSLAYEQGFVEEFSMQGTLDECNYFTLPTAIDFFQSLGAERIYAYNTSLITWASNYLSTVWGTETLLPLGQRAPFMAAIRIPWEFPTNSNEDDMHVICDRICDLLYDNWKCVAKLCPFQGRLYVRISAQIYNERQDYIRLAEAVTHLLLQPNISLSTELGKLDIH